MTLIFRGANGIEAEKGRDSQKEAQWERLLRQNKSLIDKVALLEGS